MQADDVFVSPQSLAEALTGTGYLADDGLATVAYLARALDRPLLLGRAGHRQDR